jgi:hypothetical protein
MQLGMPKTQIPKEKRNFPFSVISSTNSVNAPHQVKSGANVLKLAETNQSNRVLTIETNKTGFIIH